MPKSDGDGAEGGDGGKPGRVVLLGAPHGHVGGVEDDAILFHLLKSIF